MSRTIPSRTTLSHLPFALVCFVVVGMLTCGHVAAEEWGDLSGRFVFDGTPPAPSQLNAQKKTNDACDALQVMSEELLVDKNGGLANVVFYVRTRNVAIHPDYEKNVKPQLTFDNKGCRFQPHVLTIWYTKQQLRLHNSDPSGHNSNLQPILDQGINPLIPAGAEVLFSFNREQTIPVPVSCNIHPWMKGHILPRSNPYATISAADGTFKLEKLPAGELEFQVWHEKCGYVQRANLGGGTVDWARGRFTMTIAPGENDLGTITLSPATLKVAQR